MFRRLSFKRALRFARRKARRAGANLWLWAVPELNPFLRKALRIEARRKRPFFTVAGLMIAMLLVNGGLWWFWNILHDQFPRELNPFGERYLLPGFLGGNVIGGVAIFTLACCATAVFLTCGTHAAQILREEVLGGTLEQLQLLPQREERWLWMMRAHKTALSLLIFACGLPIFSLAVFTAHWSVWDIFGLLLIFVCIGHTAPIWMPLQWQVKQNQGRRFDWKAWQEAVKLSQRENADLAKSSLAGQLEAQRRLSKVWDNLDEKETGAPDENPKKTVGFFNVTQRNNAQGGNWWMIFVGLQMLNPIIQILSRAPGSPLSVLWSNLKAALPPEVLTLAPGFLVTWPLLLEKILRAPLPFFAFALPPLVICVPLWLARQYLGNMTLAASVSLGETFWNPRRVRTRKIAATVSALCFFLLIFGYGWQTLIPDATLAAVLRSAPLKPHPLTPIWSLAALWTLLLIVATIVGGNAQEAPFKRAQSAESSAAQAVRQAFFIMPRALALAVAAYFVCCLLGAHNGANSLFWQRLAPTTMTALAFWLADFSAGALLLALPAAQRGFWRALRFLWFYGLLLAALAHGLAGAIEDVSFSFARAPYVMLSPFVTLFALLRTDLNSGVPWLTAIVGQLLLALLCFGLAARKIYGTEPRAGAQTEAVTSGLPLPLRWISDAVVAFWRGIAAFFNGIGELSRRAENGVVRWSARWGNPVINDEVKRRVRREHWPAVWLLLPLSGALLWWQAEWFGGTAFGTPRPEVAGVTLFLAGIVAFLSALRLGSAFDRDRANGTLVFLFLTPLTETQIATGKLVAGLIFSFGLLLGALPFLAVATLLQWFSGDFLLPFYWLLALIFIFTALMYFSHVNLLCAVLSRKPTQGTGNGLVVTMFSQMLLAGTPLFAAWIVEKFTGHFPWDNDTGPVLLVLWVWLANLTLTVFAWRFTIKALRKQRYADDVTRGKGAS